MIEPREYQLASEKASRDAAARGITRQIIALATGLGKTVVAARILAERPGRKLFLAHRDELLRQTKDKILMVDPAADVGYVKAEEDDVHSRIVVASVQTLCRPARLQRFRQSLKGDMFRAPEPLTTVFVDECFPAGTPIGDRAIQDVRVGDLVPAYDETTGAGVAGRVAAVMQQSAAQLVRVRLANGRSLVCTPNHPFLTQYGWTAAVDLLPLSEVRCELQPVLEPGAEAALQADAVASAASVLLGGVQRRVEAEGVVGDNGAHEPSIRFSQDEGAQSDATAWSSRQDGRDAAQDRPQAADPSRKRQWSDDPTAASRDRSRLADGGCDSDEAAEGQRLPDLLQGGRGESGDARGNRRRRAIARPAVASEAGSEEGRALAWARVDGVEILERGSDGTFGGLCPDGLVYNLEVERFHTYLADGVVVHNCHHSAADSYLEVLRGLGCLDEGGPLTIGLTATPERADGRALGDVWQEIVYAYGILDGIRGGYLCELKAKQIKLQADFSQLHVRAGEFRDEESAELLMEADAPKHAAKAYLQHAAGERAVVFTPTVAVALAMERAFRSAGVSAEAVHGEMPMDQRRAILSRLERGETLVAPNAQLLTEGWDCPPVSVAIMARPTRSRPFAIQMIGRILRPYPGKKRALVLDLVGSTVRMDLVTVASLFDVTPEAAEHGILAATTAKASGAAALPAPDGKLITVDVELFNKREYAWVPTSKGHFVLSLGAKGNVVLKPTGPDRWDVWKIKRVKTERVNRGGWPIYEEQAEKLYADQSLGYAQGRAEAYVRQRDAIGLNLKDAHWRKGPASDKQREVLAKRGRWRDGLTKGEATDMITAMTAR